MTTPENKAATPKADALAGEHKEPKVTVPPDHIVHEGVEYIRVSALPPVSPPVPASKKPGTVLGWMNENKTAIIVTTAVVAAGAGGWWYWNRNRNAIAQNGSL